MWFLINYKNILHDKPFYSRIVIYSGQVYSINPEKKIQNINIVTFVNLNLNHFSV